LVVAPLSAKNNLEHTGDLFTDPLSQIERDDLSWYLEEYWKWPYLEFAERGKRVEALLDDVGRRFYHALFGSREAQNIIQAWQQQVNNQHRISIVSELASILRLPWELLADSQGVLVLHADHPISLVRRLPTQSEQASLTTPFQLPLRVLLVTARPVDAGFVDPRSISRELVDELQIQSEAGNIELEFLRPPTFRALSDRLKNAKRPIHVLHFDGHGGLDQKAQQGVLLFETNAGKQSPVKASDVAKVLSTSGVRLAVLTACQSAMNIEDDAFSSISTQLITNGVDAVVAMSSSILVTSAALYVEAFYHALAEGLPVSIAQEQGRQALQRDPYRHLFRRRQDEEGTRVKLCDWWIPHFYQQRLVLFQLAPSNSANVQPSQTFPLRYRSSQMPAEPRYGFNGRAHELQQIERYLLQGKVVVLHGFGGIGKTALARESADWLTRTRMYDGACFVSFESGRGSATSLLSQLGFFLGIYNGIYTPDDPKKAMQQIQAALSEQRMLVIVDNLESILPDGEAELSVEERTELWNTLLDLQRLGAGVLLTTRITAFGDERFAVGAQVMYLQLGGLAREDAYQLASSLLTSLQIDRSRTPYHLLRELLRQLGYHPLSLQLVLPTLSTYELWQILQDFATLLPQFTDDTETGHNRSLLASLEYSLQRLKPQQRKLLPHLSVFEGGALVDNLLAITEISEADWVKLRQALEQTALLTVERLEGVEFPFFLHFHPVLIPYLRGEAEAQDEVLKARYAQRYYEASNYYYDQDNRHPIQMRLLVLRELPNLRRAFGWLLEGEDSEQVVDMADKIGRFLTHFGLYRELQRVHQCVAEAFATGKPSIAGTLTQAEYLHESSLGEEEVRKGHQKSARSRFQRLLARIESQPEGKPHGSGSFEHGNTLGRLGQCLLAEGNYAAAEQMFRRAIALSEDLIQHDPDNQNFLLQQAIQWTNLGNVLLDQGQYAEGRQAYEQALQINERIDNLSGQAISQAQLGAIALEQEAYPEARRRYQQAIDTFRALGEPAMEAGSWHQLGRVAQREENWPEAERDFRESLLLSEQLGNRVKAAETCSHLGQVATFTHRFAEAKGWFLRAVQLSRQVQPTSGDHATHLSNLAGCLIVEVQAGTVQDMPLLVEEARQYAEQALAIGKNLHGPELWKTFTLLAIIAEMQEHHEAVHAYRRQEKDAYVSFAGNRYQIDQRFGQHFPVLARAQDDLQVRAQMEEYLSQVEANGGHISEAIHRIWAGDRDWHALVENLNNREALFVLRVLETLAGG
jgi:tetratricopeptide (TPR) repeat protein